MNEISIKILLDNGYFHIREVPNIGVCGIHRMAFTVGLFCGLDENTYQYRYCFHSYYEAVKSINEWSGVGDPPGNWIKRKGEGGDYSNPNYEKSESFYS